MVADRRRPVPAEYHLMSVGEKQAVSMATMREPQVSCPVCDTQLMPVDLVAHVDRRCSGPRQPGPGSRWINRRDAMAFGEPLATITRGARERIFGDPPERQYLLRDVAMTVVQRRLERKKNGDKHQKIRREGWIQLGLTFLAGRTMKGRVR